MELKINERDLKKMLTSYYKQRDGVESQLLINKTMENDRFGPECYVEVTLKRKIRLLGEERTISETLSENDVKKAVKEIIEAEGFDVYSVTFESGISDSWEGYGVGEHKVSKPYFGGVTVNLREKVKRKTLIGELI